MKKPQVWQGVVWRDAGGRIQRRWRVDYPCCTQPRPVLVSVRPTWQEAFDIAYNHARYTHKVSG